MNKGCRNFVFLWPLFIKEMDLKGKKIILGSNSPRRKELLAGMDIDFTVDTLNTFEETYSPETPHAMIPQILSEGKSYGFHRQLEEDEILITSDTLVLCKGHVMGKPRSRDEAIEMLQLLSGCSHQVITAITIRDIDKCITSSDTANVHFKELTYREIEYYIDKFKPFDKAGAYGIQGAFAAWVQSIEGDYHSVVGLPVSALWQVLKDLL